ncbi:hypothetical protein [Vibrio phage KSF1]|uniref:Uncharacterized protein ORF III n=1 Tax=Vibrio phage KSF1 TaxID=292443 RepID=Q64EV6_9VIRU|nr:hypothetical protein KSF-1phigpORFIII [Vibrio phage KSF1]AAU14798.1 hypothetical protein [Vibrio phage KSF1]
MLAPQALNALPGSHSSDLNEIKNFVWLFNKTYNFI